MKSFSQFIMKCREIREKSFQYGAYPVTEEEALIMYTITFEKAVSMKGLNIVEVGSGCGYSGVWFLKALEDSGYLKNSRMVMIEQNRKRVEILKKVLKEMGYFNFAEVKIGDAKEILKTIESPVHIAFLDAAKNEYHVYLKLLDPKMPHGSIIFAHNFEEYWGMEEYVKIVTDRKKYITSPLPTSLSLAISIKV